VLACENARQHRAASVSLTTCVASIQTTAGKRCVDLETHRGAANTVPSEHSSGGTRRQGGIIKAGNGAARRMLIEAA
jgi:transposase